MRLAVINGLRGFAIIGVYTVHTFSNMEPNGPFKDFISVGWFGVPLFFLLSGFVLMLPFSDRPLDTGRFYVRRLIRLYPLYIIVCVVCILCYGSDAPGLSKWALVFHVVTITTFFMPYDVPGNTPLWSLAVEFYLSALFPLLCLLGKRLGFVPISCAFVGVTLVLKTVHVYLQLDSRVLWHCLLILQALCEFTIGMTLAIWWQSGKLQKVIARPQPTFLLSAEALFLLLLSHAEFRGDPIVFGWQVLFWPAADVLLGAVVASALVLRHGVLRGILSFWPLQLCGMMCYSIYIWHMPLLGSFGWLCRINCRLVPMGAIIPLLVVSAISYKFIEFPTRSWRECFVF
jgi:peptidoglycan/LPS O-acetylase OafA/YrhL